MIVTVMYPVGPGQKFDVDYYLKKHMPLVEARWTSLGLTKWQVLKGVGSPTGAPATYHIIATLDFPSVEAFGAAVQKHGGEVMGDIPNFTDTQPTIQFNDVIS
jgi:uncharacterized protein (TIGR02118 family)